LPVSVFCVLQGNGVTPLKCGEIYDMGFVANLMENTIVKKNKNRSIFVTVMKECAVAQFLLRHGVGLVFSNDLHLYSDVIRRYSQSFLRIIR